MPQAVLPLIDISPLLQRADAALRQQVATQIGDACRTQGFFYITGHGIATELQAGLQAASEAFFALPQAEKMRIGMQHGARAVLTAGGSATPEGQQALHLLDRQMLALNASPGGAADLLAATLFLDRIGTPYFKH